jgi:hypothetical protein
MNRTQKPFPERDLPQGHQQIRDLLVREAARTSSHKPSRWPTAVPIAALAVAIAVAGSTFVIENWTRITQGPAAHIEDAQCGYARHVDPRQGSDVLYLAPAPAGWTSQAHLNQERSCVRETDPVAAFVRTDRTGTIIAAVTIWRSLPPEDGSPEGAAVEDPDLLKQLVTPTGSAAPAAGPGGAGTATSPPATPVTVRSRPGWLIGNDALTWTEQDGRRWAVTASGVTVERLTSIVDSLVITETAGSWPDASAQDYQQLAIPRVATKPAAWQPVWYVCYSHSESGACTLSVVVRRSGQHPSGLPWQTLPSLGSTTGRLVDVAGRPGLLVEVAPDQQMLETEAADGTRLSIAGVAPPDSTMAEFAAKLTRVAPDDPGIHLADVGGKQGSS